MKATHIGWVAAHHALDEARRAQAADYAPRSRTAAQDAESKLQLELNVRQQRWSALRAYGVARQFARDTKAAA